MEAVQSILQRASVITLGMFIVLAARGLRAKPHLLVPLLLLGSLTLVLTYLSDYYLIVNNIERIHFIQYAVLALLVKMSVENDTLVLLTCSFAGMFDEFLQHVMNPRRTSYLDFNDFVLNVLGVALGLVLAAALDQRTRFGSVQYEKGVRNGLVAFTAFSLAIILLGVTLGRIISFEENTGALRPFSFVDGKLYFILSFERHEQFWSVSLNHGKRFHVLSLTEGMVVLAGLLTFFAASFRYIKSKVKVLSSKSGREVSQV
jgi:hypothetical protein